MLGRGLLTSPGDEWRRQRRIVQPLFTPRRVEGYLGLMAEESAALAARAPTDGEQRRPAPADDALHAPGRRPGALRRRHRGHGAGARRAGARGVERRPGGGCSGRQGPVDAGGSRRTGAPGCCAPGSTASSTRSCAARPRPASRRTTPERDDLVTRLREATDPETGEHIGEDEVRDQALIFLMAGHETTAGALTFTLHLLGTAPRDPGCGRRGGPRGARRRPTASSADQLARLTLTKAALQEGMRLFPSAHTTDRLHRRRRSTSGGYRLPAAAAGAGLALDDAPPPGFWPDPQRFDPSRFLGAGRPAALRVLPLRRRPAGLRRRALRDARGGHAAGHAAAVAPRHVPAARPAGRAQRHAAARRRRAGRLRDAIERPPMRSPLLRRAAAHRHRQGRHRQDDRRRRARARARRPAGGGCCCARSRAGRASPRSSTSRRCRTSSGGSPSARTAARSGRSRSTPRPRCSSTSTMFYHLGRAGKALDKFGVIDFATTIAPGVRDVLLIGKVYEATRPQADGEVVEQRSSAYDAVVLDAPPTGRIGRFLNVNTEVVGIAKVGPIRNQASSIMRLLKSDQSKVHFVTTLEEMPVQETLDGDRRAAPDRPVRRHRHRQHAARAAAVAGRPARRRGRHPRHSTGSSASLTKAGITADDAAARRAGRRGGGARRPGRPRADRARRGSTRPASRSSTLPYLAEGVDLGALYDFADQLRAEREWLRWRRTTEPGARQGPAGPRRAATGRTDVGLAVGRAGPRRRRPGHGPRRAHHRVLRIRRRRQDHDVGRAGAAAAEAGPQGRRPHDRPGAAAGPVDGSDRARQHPAPGDRRRPTARAAASTR